MSAQLRCEYQHLAEGPYGRGMDGAVKAGRDGKPQSAAGGSTALVLGDSAQQADSEAARRAREVLVLACAFPESRLQVHIVAVFLPCDCPWSYSEHYS